MTKRVFSIIVTLLLVMTSIPSDIFAAAEFLSDDIPAPSFTYTVSQNNLELWLSDDVPVSGYTVFFSKQLDSQRLLEKNVYIYESHTIIDTSSLEPGEYYVGVSAWAYRGSDILRSSYYSYRVISIITTRIPTPSLVTVKTGNNGYVTIAWSKDDLADGYYVFYSQDGGQYKGFGSVNEKGKYYFTGQVPTNHQYTFAVKQYRKDGDETLVSSISSPSQSVLITGPTVASPSNVTVKGGNNCATISWNPVSGADGYYIFETNSIGGNPVYVGETKAGTYYKTVTGLSSGFHYYVVRAYDVIDNQSYFSNLSSAKGDYVSYSYSNYPANLYNVSSTVYITQYGKKYHNYWCGHLWNSCIPITLSQAKARGYTPCLDCW